MEPASEILIYQTQDGLTRIQTVLQDESVWVSLNQMTDLFQRDKSVISRHISNVFEEGELEPESVVANFATTAADGKTYQVSYYNLDIIISVGYRVKSHRGTQFLYIHLKKIKSTFNHRSDNIYKSCYTFIRNDFSQSVMIQIYV